MKKKKYKNDYQLLMDLFKNLYFIDKENKKGGKNTNEKK